MKQCKMYVIIVLIFFTSACQINHNHISDLLINLSDFPPGWSVSTDGPNPIAKAPLGGTKYIESTELFFYAYGGSAYEDIQLYNRLDGATKEYIRQKDNIFRETDFTTPWITPNVLSLTIQASQYFFACSQSTGSPWPECDYIAQYDRYLVHFHTGMFPGYMNYQDFGKIVEAIDVRMIKFANK